ncbi:heavy metal-binding domain-containing protein [Robiginitalea aurantiaca]|uniref:Heavy metal-binding domain-containing protein n=1 Tax=Robiginitalea aurantiaca TaxID=3056915 RepID=A0ABT7WBK7_9FLAO|nr:heavy metal-binding domain-containing protein [Robiginitalea aurantiaca]MDM9630292.1 heavy metal-binding domain-containing protein [Robiginitalea aurantiaca]
MKIFKSLLVVFLTLLFTATSCKEEKKAETKSTETEVQTGDTESQLMAEAHYQCPMDCEDGKTYGEPGTCPVCKMDLKPVSKETAMTCKMHADGECTCDGEKCACENCPKHSGTQ